MGRLLVILDGARRVKISKRLLWISMTDSNPTSCQIQKCATTRTYAPQQTASLLDCVATPSRYLETVTSTPSGDN
jgi:hypothetical protein